MNTTATTGYASTKFVRSILVLFVWLLAGSAVLALNVASLDIGFTCTCSNNVYIRPHILFTRILDADLRASVADSSLVNFGVAVGKEF